MKITNISVWQLDLLRIQTEGIAEVVNIKINRVGGLTQARRPRDFCLATRFPCW